MFSNEFTEFCKEFKQPGSATSRTRRQS